jgi:uncharacterized protein (TIGR02145 family)
MRTKIILLFVSISALSFSQKVEHFIDARDNQKYKAVTIGKQTWMAENLNVAVFRNGDTIPEIQDAEAWIAAKENQQPAWCYYDNDPENGKEYGKLYNWYAVNDPRGLAPEGWHVASEEEWETMNASLYTDKKVNVNDALKSDSGWKKEKNGTNSTGFNALPAGCRKICGSFDSLGENTKWWTSTKSEGYGSRGRGPGDKRLKYMYGYQSAQFEGLSVRCVKD